MEMTFEQAEKRIDEYLGRIWEDTPFNNALIKYQKEVGNLKQEVRLLKKDNDDLRCCLQKAEDEARYYQRQCQVVASHLK